MSFSMLPPEHDLFPFSLWDVSMDGDFDFVVSSVLVEEIFEVLAVGEEASSLAGPVVGYSAEVVEWCHTSSTSAVTLSPVCLMVMR